MKTIRLKIPQWQGGNKSNYAFGSELLTWLAPKNANHVEIDVAIPKYSGPLEKENGVVGQSVVAANIDLINEKIQAEQPDKIIALGGDCLVSQAPFDYLHGKYGDDLGIIWIDAHPDISTPDVFYHEHAMVLGNLLEDGDPVLAAKVKAPFKSADVLYVGLQEPTSDEKKILADLDLNYQVQKNERLSPEAIQKWLKENHFSKVVVHFDLDVLNPSEFRSLYFTEPGVTEFPSESGQMSLKEVQATFAAISEVSEIVGLTIAEYLPWDAENLQQLLSGISIFQ
ncbi:arginase family protein [Enterococcus sp. HY326]|uniref:arginase family protein n=1 Tax=Enterococcus sp. HY326 TaxID=2971265 RepID=UPI002240CA71|nr:arginase family protein [Enterococcus sp. HY326]